MDVKDSMLAQAQGFDKALAAFVRDCQREHSADCPVGTGKVADGVQQIADLLSQADSKPLQVGDRELTQSLALLGVALTLYDRQNGWPNLRVALEAALGGDGSALMQMSDAYTERNADGIHDDAVRRALERLDVVRWDRMSSSRSDFSALKPKTLPMIEEVRLAIEPSSNRSRS